MNKISRDHNGCAICLSIDVDSFSPALYDGRETDAAALSRGEFDTRTGVPRLLALLRDIDAKATFFVPGYTADCFPGTLEAIAAAGHEVGHHGYLHEPPARLTPGAEAEALDRGLDALQRRAGIRPAGYRAPLWEPSTVTIGLLEERGFAYDSSLMGDDRPYWHAAGGARILELPIHWSLDDYIWFGMGRRTQPTATSAWLDAWTDELSCAAREDRPTTLTFHPEVIGRGYRALALGRLLGQLARTGATVLTHGELAARGAPG
jgi:peptidoglycan-N-acetylglucosamine deacetylase